MVIQETVVGIIVRLFINQSWSEFVLTADGSTAQLLVLVSAFLQLRETK